MTCGSVGREPTDSYGRRSHIARRLVECGVHFVQLDINRHIWDTHNSIATELKAACDDEFGRLPIAQPPTDKDERKAGGDHNKNAFDTWMAGGGVKPGITCGATDELGLNAVEDKVSVRDWHAMILHMLGMGRRSSGVEEARVVKGILA